MLRVGLTGGIGSGKSEVARRLASYGAVLIDSDVLAREVVAPGTEGMAAVVEAFGDAVVAADGSLDRAALGRQVFADPAARRRLEAIVHPRVRARAAEIEAAAAADDPRAVVVHDIPLLVETGRADSFDVVVVVDLPEDLQVERLTKLRRMTPEDARARIAAQAPRERRLAAADVVIDNAGDLAALTGQVRALWRRLAARS
ncbi:dephospho-CoA kinase [Actinopolymorpha alba]|uniref:dephospho-CoA kinase n=1 Tax=Actinopolymorpha alba TaxID=533267 RepID=UPI0003A3CBCA|nr:dephospho-CoA kinase [Actinopolymorpha alba]